MTPKTKNYLTTKIQQLKDRKFSVLYLGDEGKEDISIESSKDLARYADYAKIETDNMLKYNKKIETWTVVLIFGLYLTGLAIILFGVFLWKNPALTSTGTVAGLGISITWPIKKLLEIRESNFHLQKFLLLIPLLSPEDAGERAERVLFGKE